MTDVLDIATAGDMVRAMVLLHGWKVRRGEPWTTQLQAIENAYRRYVMLDVLARASIDDDAKVEESQPEQPG